MTGSSRPVCGASSGTQCGFGRNRQSATMSASTGRPYLKPNETTLIRSAASASVANASRIRDRSSCTFSAEVSRIRSASARMPWSSSRSAAIPSTMRPPSCSGCGRATLSNLRTSVSSDASRKTT